MSSYLHFDGMTWPAPSATADIEHTLRYETPSRSDLLVAASTLAAYRQLVELSQRSRNARVRKLRELDSQHLRRRR